MTVKEFWGLVRAAASGWVDDYAQSMGAALAYYTMFSIAPLLLIVISMAGLFFGDEAARGEIFVRLKDLVGAPGALAVQGMLESVRGPGEGVTATFFAAALLLFGATSVLGELQDALDRIWRTTAGTGRSGVRELIHSRLLSVAMIIGIGFLLVISLVASAALTALRDRWEPVLEYWSTVASIVELGFSFLLVTAVFATIYKVMPRVRVDWRDVWLGAAVTSLLFIAGKFVLGVYIGRSGITSGFGAAASLVVVLVWVYYSAQLLLLGAEFTRAYAYAFGSHSVEASAIPSAAHAAPAVHPHSTHSLRDD
jgi:membrane protein